MKNVAVTLGSIVLFSLLSNFNAQNSRNVDNNEIQDDNFYENWDAPEEIKKSYPYYLSGYDEDKRPIWIVEFGKWDLRKLVVGGAAKVKDFDTYVDQWLYYVRKTTNKTDPTSDEPALGWDCIFDMEEYNIAQLSSVPTVGYVLKLAGKFEIAARNMDYGFLINLNYLAETLINLMKPVLGTTLDRAEIHGTNKAKWLPSILRRLPKNAIPEWYGGYGNYTPVQVYG